jgi:hypothetical protein
MNGPTIIALAVGLVIFVAIIFIVRKQRFAPVEEDAFLSGPPISQSNLVETRPAEGDNEFVSEAGGASSTPAIPEDGLPDGWSMEQWVHYGQQYLDRLGKQP